MAENVLESGPPSAKRPKLSSPALSASASDGNGKYFLLYLVNKQTFTLWMFSLSIACFCLSVNCHVGQKCMMIFCVFFFLL